MYFPKYRLSKSPSGEWAFISMMRWRWSNADKAEQGFTSLPHNLHRISWPQLLLYLPTSLGNIDYITPDLSWKIQAAVSGIEFQLTALHLLLDWLWNKIFAILGEVRGGKLLLSLKCIVEKGYSTLYTSKWIGSRCARAVLLWVVYDFTGHECATGVTFVILLFCQLLNFARNEICVILNWFK